MDAAEIYITVLQEQFPNVTVKWNPQPHPIFETTPCVLEFHSKTGLEEPFILTFKDGLGNNQVDKDLEVLITAYGKQINSL